MLRNRGQSMASLKAGGTEAKQQGTEQLTKLGTLAFQAIPIFAIWSVPGWWLLVENHLPIGAVTSWGQTKISFVDSLPVPALFLL